MGKRVVILAVLVLSAAVAPVASRPAKAASTAAPGGRCIGYAQPAAVSQAPDGAVSACVSIGPTVPGTHHVALVDWAAAVRPTGRLGPAVRLDLRPSSGPPGTRIEVTGFIARPVPHHGSSLQACWDGCPNGLPYDLASTHWVSDQEFRLSLVAPDAPWFDPVAERVHPLMSGPYAIGVSCLVWALSCRSSRPNGSAVFHLHVPSTNRSSEWCRRPSSCAELAVTPPQALPGQSVRVRGFAPLTSLSTGRHMVAGVIRVTAGPPRGPAVRVFRQGRLVPRKPGTYLEAAFGDARLGVMSPPPYATLRTGHVTSLQPEAIPTLAIDPTNPGRVASCRSGAVVVQSGEHRTVVSTAGVAAAARVAGLAAPFPWCNGVALLPHAVLASFVVPGAPGTGTDAGVAMVTTDNGAHWRLIPTPAGLSAGAFGGWRTVGRRLEVLFVRPGRSPVPAAETTMDGRSWAPSSLSCPTAGPCVTFGADQTWDCARFVFPQPLLASTDGGRRWVEPRFPGVVNGCVAGALFAVSRRDILLADGAEPWFLLGSTDGGVRWHVVGLPRLAGLSPFAGAGLGSASITVLPRGALLVTGPRFVDVPGSDVQVVRNRWELLRPGGHRWCAVTGVSPRLFSTVGGVVASGSDLWWAGKGGPRRVPLADLRCG